MQENLGQLLRNSRIAAGLSLRGVQARTDISNAYLSQLETGKAENPAPALLRKLALLYHIDYELLLQAAGYASSSSGSSRDLFLSHRGIDKVFVRELAADIENESYGGGGLKVWLDEAEIRPGQSIPALVNEGLEKSRFVAILMTPEYFRGESGWTDAEWHAVLHADPDNRTGRILPLLVRDCPFIPYLLRHLKAIDLRGTRYAQGLRELLSVLRNEPLPRPITHRGQLITSGTRIDRSTLVAERAVPEADPDVVTERLYCNLLPVERLPRYIYTGAIAQDSLKTSSSGKKTLPSKVRLKEIIRQAQEDSGIEAERRFMPAFRVFEDRIVTFHDLEDSDGPLSAIVDENDIELVDVPSFIRDEDLRNIVISLLNMSLARHLGGAGLIVDDTRRMRFFFPDRDGQANVVTWTPRKN